jgi:type IV pilus assembly protein PilA
MLQALRRRQEQNEEGFTLIELMVVVLIIAILLAIAIPTFLGARTRAQDRAAQSNLRNGLTGEKVFFTDNQQYGTAVAASADLAALQGIEPAIRWFDTNPPAAVQGNVGVSATHVNGAGAALDNVVLGAKSASGVCFYEMDESIALTAGGTVPGTWYAVNNACIVPATPLAVAPVGTKAVNATPSVWAASF